MKNKKKIIVVGQGLAGTMMTHFLLESGTDVVVVDRGHDGSSTKIAAGLINPVTGRRYVKSWRIDELLPFARRTYSAMEDLLGVRLYEDRNIIRALNSVKDENEWLARCIDPDYVDYMIDRAPLGPIQETTASAFAYGEVRGGAQVKIGLLVERYRQFLLQKGLLIDEEFSFLELEVAPILKYRGIPADGIVFCEGHRGGRNPFFNYLPFHGDKGEVLIVKMEKAGYEKCLKNKIFIVPLEKDLYWIGATYERNFEVEHPTAEGKAFLLSQLKALVKLPFEVVNHQAAVRPTVRDRRPFLGRHPRFDQLLLFNGMGTKGTSLAPFWAKHLCEHLLEGKPLDREVDIDRFIRFFQNEKTQ